MTLNEKRILTDPFSFNGQGHSKLEEPLGVDLSYPIQWRESRVDLSELAKLREKGWTTEELARHFNRKTPTIRGYYGDVRKRKD